MRRLAYKPDKSYKTYQHYLRSAEEGGFTPVIRLPFPWLTPTRHGGATTGQAERLYHARKKSRGF